MSSAETALPRTAASPATSADLPWILLCLGLGAVVALAILFCIGLYGYRTMFGYTYDSSLSDEDLAASVTADENITNIALFGLDTREGDKQSHSDCMMIVTVDNTRGKIKLISLMNIWRRGLLNPPVS